jgi:hypothetical protein
MGGCTDCGKKGGCDTRKHGMFAAVDAALERLYPTRRWGERDEVAALDGGFSRDEGQALALAIAQRLGTRTLYRVGDADEWCDYVYVLCLGRTPCIAEIREDARARGESLGAGVVPGAALPGAPASTRIGAGDAPAGEVVEDGGETGLDERYLRVVLSSVARLAGVQEVAMTLTRQGDDLIVEERARGGVFDPVLLPRFQALVAVLATWEIRHVDFGEIVEAPADFDPAGYPDRFGAAPLIANYLFYPQPPTAVSTTVLRADGAAAPAPLAHP